MNLPGVVLEQGPSWEVGAALVHFPALRLQQTCMRRAGIALMHSQAAPPAHSAVRCWLCRDAAATSSALAWSRAHGQSADAGSSSSVDACDSHRALEVCRFYQPALGWAHVRALQGLHEEQGWERPRPPCAWAAIQVAAAQQSRSSSVTAGACCRLQGRCRLGGAAWAALSSI